MDRVLFRDKPFSTRGFYTGGYGAASHWERAGKGYSEIASEVKELCSQGEKLISEVGDLKAKESRAKELKGEVEESEEKVQKLGLQKEQLEKDVNSLKSFLQKRAEALGIPLRELQARLRDLASLEKK